MATFDYEALTQSGRLLKGTLDADSPEHARELLGQMRLAVQSVTKARRKMPGKAISRSEFALFNQQLASLAKAGIPLERGLRELAGDIGSATMRRAVSAVADDLEAGMSLDQAFSRHGAQFPPLYGYIVKAGVRSGRLGEMLTSLNRHLDLSRQTRRIIFEGMAYPLMVLLLATIVMTGMVCYLGPQLELLRAELRSFSDAPASPGGQGWVLEMQIAGVLVILGAAVVVVSTLAAGRRFRESLLLRLPVLGRIYRGCILSRLADAMALLVGAGCDMPSCLRLGAASSGSELARRQCEDLAQRVERGEPMGLASFGRGIIPGLFLYSIQAGAQRNELEDNLYGLSEMYATQARVSQGALQSLLLPVMLLVVGAFIGGGIISVFRAIQQMIQAFQFN